MDNLEKKQVLVTVGITSFERPITLRHSIQSIINQTYTNLEILICDDYSRKYDVKMLVSDLISSDSRIKFIQRSKQFGVTENVNYMVKSSSGKYFLWLCDDDWIDIDYIEKCLNYIELNKGYSLVTGATKFYLGDKFLYNAEKINVENFNPVERFLNFHEQSLGTANCPNFGLISREFLLETPLKNILGHDNILIGNIVLKGKLKTLSLVFVNRRLGGMSETLNKMSKVCNYSFLEKYFSFFGLFLNLISDIIMFKASYKNYSFFKRIIIAIRFTFKLINNFHNCFSKYLFYRFPRNFNNTSDIVKNKRLKNINVSVKQCR